MFCSQFAVLLETRLFYALIERLLWLLYEQNRMTSKRDAITPLCRSKKLIQSRGMSISSLPFSADSDVFRAFQRLWKEEVGEELTYEYAEQNPKLLALMGAVARWKRQKATE